MKKRTGLTNADAKELFEGGSVVVFKCEATKEFPITFVSKNVKDILGFEPNFFHSKSNAWSERIHPEDKDEVGKQFTKILADGGSTINEYRFKKKDGDYIWLRDEIKLQYDLEGNPKAILGACFEITDRKKSELEAQKVIEKELRKRLSYQHALSRCSNLLIDGSYFDTVEKALKILLTTTDTDRVYIFTREADEQHESLLSQIHEVCGEGITPEIDNSELQKMPLNSLPWVFRQISENKIINLPIKELPSPEREFMMDQEIKSFLLIPIFIEDDWFGFLGFDSTRYEKIWDEHEITLLKTASDIIGTYFKRKSVEESLLQQKNFTQEILNSLPGIVVLVNKKLEFLQWNKTAERLIGYTKEELSKMNAYDIIAPEDHKNLESTLLRVLQRDNEGQELTLLHKNGKRNPYFWRRNFLELDGETVFINVGLNISKQKEMEHALLEEKRLADAIINSLPGIFYIINRKGNYVRVNNNFLKEFDYTESEVLNMTPLDFYSPKEHKEVTERLEKLFAGGSASFELNPMAKSGKKIPYYLKTVRFDRKNESYVIGTGHNISEQKVKEAELLASVKEKDVLLQEIHHRVKNNLAVISGLLQLQSYEFEDPEFQRMVIDSQRRIQTMAMIHEKLYQSESLSRISVLSYIDELISQIENSVQSKHKKIEIETKIEDTDLNINQAIPFALAMNEIISNSFEHAFKGQDKGHLFVEVRESKGILHALIKDDGVGFPEGSENQSTSLGMTLIKALLTQIGAEWTINSEKGVCYNISFLKDKEKGSSSAL